MNLLYNKTMALTPIVRYKEVVYCAEDDNTLQIVKEDIEGDYPKLDELPWYFGRKCLLIDSINSGTGRDTGNDIALDLIIPLFELLEIEFEYLRTLSRSSVDDFAANSAVDDDLFVIFISGDTSISEFVNSLPANEHLNRKLTIANIAAGTGNALLLSLKICDPIESVANLFVDSTRPIELNKVKFVNCTLNITVADQAIKHVTQRFFMAVFSWLFHAALVADSDTPTLRKLGLQRFGIAAKKNLESLQEYRAKLAVDGTELSAHSHSYLLYTNLSNLEKNFKISPKGNLRDLYLVEVPSEVQGAELMTVMTKLYQDGAHVDADEVNYLQVTKSSRLTIPSEVEESKLRFCIDGSIIQLQRGNTTEHITIEIIKSGIPGWEIEIVSKELD